MVNNKQSKQSAEGVQWVALMAVWYGSSVRTETMGDFFSTPRSTQETI